MLISFVTVNKNSGVLLDQTSKSIISFLRTNKNHSWLIIDSNSNDQSDICIKNLLKLKDDLPINIIRENDDGIYQAMNKAIKNINSKYLLFINSGDTLNESDLLNTLKATKKFENHSIICGYIIRNRSKIILNELKRIINNLEIAFKLRLPTSHNSIVYLTESLKKFYFNEKFKCSADYNQYLEMLEDNQNFIDKRKYKIVNISNDGFISKRRSESYQDCITINTEKGRIIGIIYWKIKFLILNLISL